MTDIAQLLGKDADNLSDYLYIMARYEDYKEK